MKNNIFSRLSIFVDRFKFVKFVLAGSIASLADLTVLYSLTEFFGVYYLVSAGFSFSFGFTVSFLLQKFWTFKNKKTNNLNIQILRYFLIFSVSLIVGIIILYFVVNKFGIYYIYGQILVDSNLAIGRFFISKYLIFKNETTNKKETN